MAIEKIHTEDFLQLAVRHPVLDVRSPGEYKHAHIPGSHNLPLFTNEERKAVGTIYKQESRKAAIKVGLDFFGPKMHKMVEDVETIVKHSGLAWNHSRENSEKLNGQIPAAGVSFTDNCVLVHCWRGGMRSAAIAWLLDLYGFKVYSLTGGYKKYRNYVLQTFKTSYHFKILGGYTGSGKTIVLNELEGRGQKIIDLEAIACHKGSAFGAIGQALQPTQEMFENLLSAELRKKATETSGNGSAPCIWLEDESQRIGLVNIEPSLWNQMRQSPVYFLDITFEERLNYIRKCYGSLDEEKMANAIVRIKKRLGGLDTKMAINFLSEGNTTECFRILLKYYDKYYLRGLHNRDSENLHVNTVVCEKVDAVANAQRILAFQNVLPAANFLTDE